MSWQVPLLHEPNGWFFHCESASSASFLDGNDVCCAVLDTLVAVWPSELRHLHTSSAGDLLMVLVQKVFNVLGPFRALEP